MVVSIVSVLPLTVHFCVLSCGPLPMSILVVMTSAGPSHFAVETDSTA